jgi:hypothetical protein
MADEDLISLPRLVAGRTDERVCCAEGVGHELSTGSSCEREICYLPTRGLLYSSD